MTPLRLLLIWALAIFELEVSGQDSLPPRQLRLGVGVHYGFIIPHNPNMKYLIKSHVPALEIRLAVRTNGERKWERIYKLPDKGLGFYAANLGNPEELGWALGFFPYINFPLNPDGKVKFYLRTCDGIGIITKPYNRLENHKNNAIGSYFNAFINLQLSTSFNLSSHLRIESGFGLTHLSNGAFSKPNMGINIAGLHLAISPLLRPAFQPSKNKPLRPGVQDSSKYFLNLAATAGPSESGRPDGDKYLTLSVQSNFWNNLSDKSRFCLGADLFYSYSNLYNAVHDTVFDTSNKLNNLQLGIKVGYELVVGRFSLPLESGFYAFTKTTGNGYIYSRIGIRFMATDRLQLIYSLKTHWATAENQEIGFGYRIWNYSSKRR